ncbi:hypothetical protein ACX02_15590 [Vibrio parahaemolyticus]|uniref:hypothetical protein n=1 Tax=Vibrio parahaemolyticus TaxID=670 RepID=UPI0006C57854|nr:hypothetical protein [Vibrio parahaemolyticus]KON53775.1 hypothetical protein ACX02_15590 [Vibrio parahaemolyticus]MCS0032116.1 hypothetical protein [Vibrio parahaemolyticus]
MAINLGLKTNQNFYCSFPVKNSTPLQGELKLSWGKFIELDYTAGCHPTLDFDEDHILEVCVNNVEKVFLQGFDDHHEVFKAAFTGTFNAKRIVKVSFYTHDLSDLFSFDISDSKYLDDNGFLRLKFEPIQSSFTSEFGYVKFSIALTYNSKHELGKICFDYQMAINLEFDDFISIDNVEKIMYQLKQFFSTIIAHNFSFDEIAIRDDNGELGSLYFATNDEDYSSLKRHQHLLDTRYLRVKIDTLLKSFFESNAFEFNKIWSRVPPLLQLKHLLEYEVLIYGSILDKYVKYQCKDIIQPDWTFRKAYKEFLNKNELKKWLVPFFHNGDFNEVKSIRDRAAHGEMEQLPNQKVHNVLAKLKALIFFLMYRDLGLTEQEIISLLFNRGHGHFHPILRNCEFERYKLNALLPCNERIKEIQAKKGENLKFLNDKTDYLVFLKETLPSNNNVYTLLPELSERLLKRFIQERHYWRHIHDLKDMVWLMLPDILKRNKEVSFVNYLYLKTESHQKPTLIRQCFIIEDVIND